MIGMKSVAFVFAFWSACCIWSGQVFAAGKPPHEHSPSEKYGRGRVCETRYPDRAALAAKAKALAASPKALAEPAGPDPYVDILVAYDNGAASYAEDAGGVTNFAKAAVMKMNEALRNNDLASSFKFRLVGVALVDDTQTGIEEALDLVCDSSGRATGAWKEAQRMREATGADIVCCLVDTGDAYGLTGLGFSLPDESYLDTFGDWAYNVCAVRSVEIAHTMTHEVGHNMGAGHSRSLYNAGNRGPQLYGDSAAFDFATYYAGESEPAGHYHTIMGYSSLGDPDDDTYYEEIPYFSSPSHYWHDEETDADYCVGDDDCDNAGTLRATFSHAKAWRVQKIPAGEDDEIISISDVMRLDGVEWTVSKEFPWTVYDATTLRAGVSGRNNSAVMSAEVEGYVCLKFDYSLEDEKSELDVLVDGVAVWHRTYDDFDGWWDVATVEIPEGKHKIEIVGRKTAAGNARFWIDSVSVSRVKMPSFDPAPGIDGICEFDGDEIMVQLSAEPEVSIYYKMAGDDTVYPYESPIPVSGRAEIEAYAETSGGGRSLAATAVFVSKTFHKVSFVRNGGEADEGNAILVEVSGGNSDKPSTAVLYATYQTAAAADLDLKTGTVTGGTAVPAVQNGRDARSPGMTNLKFPLTLEWEAGDLSVKNIVLPVKADKAVENDEFFTLQIVPGEGVSCGEISEFAATIHDPEYEALCARIDSGSATKAQTNTWSKLQKKGIYVYALPSPAGAGTVSGSGFCAEGKKTTLKAKANKGFVFTGWEKTGNGEQGTGNGFVATTPSLVIDRSAKPAKDSATSTTITGVDEDSKFYACFITAEEDKASIALEVNGESLSSATGGSPSMSTNIWAGVYLEWPVAADALSGATVKVAGLPAGLKFTAKPVTSKVGSGKDAVVVTNVPANTIYGAPTSASKIDAKTGEPKPSAVKVTVTTAGKSTQSYQIDMVVDALPAWAQGAFAGGATGGTAVSAVQNGRDARSPSGVVSLTIAANGKISGKLLESGKTWTLSAAWFDEAESLEFLEPLDPRLAFTATVIGKSGKETFTGTVTIAAEDGVGVVNGRDATPARASPSATRCARGISSPSETGETPVLPVTWTAWQNLWKRADTKAGQPLFKKNFVADYAFGEPGDKNNTVKITFKKDGAVSFSGKKDGVSVIGSAQLVRRLAGDGSPCHVTLYAPPKKEFDGWCETFDVEIDVGESGVVTDVRALPAAQN